MKRALVQCFLPPKNQHYSCILQNFGQEIKTLKNTEMIKTKSSPNCLGTVLFVDTQKFNVNTQNSNFRQLKKLNVGRIGQLKLHTSKINNMH